MNRRDFIKILGIGGAVAFSSAFTFNLRPGFCNSSFKSYSMTLPLMGTFVEVTVLDDSYDKACEATHKAFVKIKKLIPMFNRFDTTSAVSFLNEKGYLNDVPVEVYEVFLFAKYINDITRGGFDVTVLPVLEIVSYYSKRGSFPDVKLFKEALECVGFDQVRFDRKRVNFLKQNMMVTFDGIAKGYIIDQAAIELKNYGITHGLINAGGDIRVIGDRKGSPWIIGIQDPEDPDKIFQKIALKDFAIATSGNYEVFFDPRKIHFHIIDKKTGFSPINTISCSVIAKTAVLADGLATGLFVSSPRMGIEWVKGLKDVEAEIITRGDRVYNSLGWNRFLVS